MNQQPCDKCGGTGIQPDHRKTGTQLRSLRYHTDLTLGDMARILGISLSFMCDLEQGNRAWTQERIDAYKKACDEA